MSTEMPKQTDSEAALLVANRLLQDTREKLKAVTFQVKKLENERVALEKHERELSKETNLLQAWHTLAQLSAARRAIEAKLQDYLDNPPSDRHDAVGHSRDVENATIELGNIIEEETQARIDVASAVLSASPVPLDIPADELPGLDVLYGVQDESGSIADALEGVFRSGIVKVRLNRDDPPMSN